jgi:MFS family permease
MTGLSAPLAYIETTLAPGMTVPHYRRSRVARGRRRLWIWRTRGSGSRPRTPARGSSTSRHAQRRRIQGITIVNVALPTLVRELHASNSQLQWVVDAYNLVFAALLLASGSLSDRLGRKGFLLAGLGVFGAGSIAGALTTTADQLIVARCFMGVGAAMIFPTTLSLISNVYTERAERARAIGLWGATAGIAIALGPIVGGWLLEQFSWTSIFFAMAPVAAVGAALVAWSVPTSRDPDANKTDGPGLVLSSAAMALLTYTIIEAPNHGWGRTPAAAVTPVVRESDTAANTAAQAMAMRPRMRKSCTVVLVG